MSVYNAEKTLSEAIESVLQQNYVKYEFIIIDDGSTDKSNDIIKKYGKYDDRIKVIEHSNQGMGKSLNIGMLSAKYDWIARFDADDVMLKNRLESQIKFINSNPDVKVVSCRAYYINEHGKILGKTSNHIKTIESFNELVRNNQTIGLLHPGAMFEKKIFNEVGGYRSQFWPAEDIDLWTRISEKGYLILIQDEVLMKYRLHQNSIVTSKSVMSQLKYEWVKKCKACRIQGNEEPDYQFFLDELNSTPLIKRINKKRKMKAKISYRNAGYHFLTNNYYLGIKNILISMLLKPSYVFKRVIKQLLF